MPKQSAGILLHRERDGVLEVLLVHPGGPFYARRDAGVWQFPKGELQEGEEPLAAALREFEEETGQRLGPASPDELVRLAPRRQAGGKVVHLWALRGDCDADAIQSNTFNLEWPPKSGTMKPFPEVDRAAWFSLGQARQRILPSQQPFLDEFESRLGAGKEP